MDFNQQDKKREKIIDELLERSVQAIFPSKDALKKILLSGKKLRVYIGADATGPDLHLGHSTNYILLEKFRQLGHEVIVLFGDFTAMIGDPSGKSDTRKPLTFREVSKNIKTWKKQLTPISRFGLFGNKTRIVRNSHWLSKLSMKELVSIASNFTVQQMSERDMFDKRIKNNTPVFLHEFLYPLLQGYDSVALDVDIEIGGNDQTFNMLAGRDLQKKFRNKEKFVIATTLLENPKTGKKLMSKSEGGYVSLLDSPKDMFGKIMALPDEVIVQMFVDCTFESIEKIGEIEKSIKSGANPKDLKMELAKTIVSIYHGKIKAEKAFLNFEKTFGKKEIDTEEIDTVNVSSEEFLSDVLLKKGIVKSKSEFVRLVKEGAIGSLERGKISSLQEKALSGVYKIGKHRFIKIIN